MDWEARVRAVRAWVEAERKRRAEERLARSKADWDLTSADERARRLAIIDDWESLPEAEKRRRREQVRAERAEGD